MAPPGESLFSTEFFYAASNLTCPHVDGFLSVSQVLGVLPHRFHIVAMAIPYAVAWLVLRRLFKAGLPPLLARVAGIKSRKKAAKISYQGWLLFYYATSSLLGAWGYHDEPWFQFPVGKKACFGMFSNYPPDKYVTPFMEWSYQFQLGFYFAELYAIFSEPRRSDFGEYVIHHLTTIALISLSGLAHFTRTGCYIFFIHDVPDVFLCAAKIFNYLKKELIANALFGIFVATFFFNRLICLPSVSYCIYCEQSEYGTVNLTLQFMTFLLAFLLQGLHIFWFILIMRMIVRLAVGVREDVRSDEDEDDAAAVKTGDVREMTTARKPKLLVVDEKL
jgi:hypothetical protein